MICKKKINKKNLITNFCSSLKDIEGYAEKGSLSSKKLLDSGFEYKYGLDEMFDGAIKSCKEKGFL